MNTVRKEEDKFGFDAFTHSRLAVLETRWADVIPTLATKADLHEQGSKFEKTIGELRGEVGELRADMGILRADVEKGLGSLRSDLHEQGTRFEKTVGELRAEISRSHNSMIRWIIGTGVVLFLGLLNADKLPGRAPAATASPAASHDAQ